MTKIQSQNVKARPHRCCLITTLLADERIKVTPSTQYWFISALFYSDKLFNESLSYVMWERQFMSAASIKSQVLSWIALILHSCLRWWVRYSITDWKEFLAALWNNMFRQLLLLSCLICSWNVSMVSANWSLIRLLPANSWGDFWEELSKPASARTQGLRWRIMHMTCHRDRVRCGRRTNWLYFRPRVPKGSPTCNVSLRVAWQPMWIRTHLFPWQWF